MSEIPYRYVLITPARNEEAYIEKTIKSVVDQEQPPVKWVIVSDGSTDRTDEIVKGYVSKYPWIELLRMPEREERHFGGKVDCIKAGCERMKDVDYEIIGNLDADLSFEPGLFSFLMGKFAAIPRLGVGGSPFREAGGTYDYRFSSTNHVSGACQLFRRECFEEIGGYTAIKGGGIDVVAVLTARMKGWETRTFPEKSLLHHRPMGTAGCGGLSARFRLGRKDYNLGRHPLWQIFRCFYQMTRRPFVVGGFALLTGYMSAAVRRIERPVSDDLVQFQRKEQLQRLKRMFGKLSPFSIR